MEKERVIYPKFLMDSISGSDALSQLAALLDACFQVSPGERFLNDFPVWDPTFGSSLSILRLGIFYENQLISATSIRICQLKTIENRTIVIALIGATATHPDWRGRGFASHTVTVATQWAEEHGATAVFLWGSEHSLYQQLGFELCGYQMRIPLSQIEYPSKPSKELKLGWHSKIFDLMKLRKSGLNLKESDRKWLEAHKNVQWFYTEHLDQPLAYVAFQRGIDLQLLVHEWGGPIDEVLGIFEKIYKLNLGAMLLISPDQVNSMGISAAHIQKESLCLAKILDPSSILSSYYPQFPIQCSYQDKRWEIHCGLDQFSHLTERKLTKLFFGSPEKGNLVTPSLFPLPLWFWGLDTA